MNNTSDTSSRPKHLILIEVLLVAITALTLLLTSPQKLGPIGVTVFFGLIFLLSLNSLELYYRARKAQHLHPFWLKTIYAALPVALLSLSSLGQLTTFDLILTIVLVVIITMYYNRRIAN